MKPDDVCLDMCQMVTCVCVISESCWFYFDSAKNVAKEAERKKKEEERLQKEEEKRKKDEEKRRLEEEKVCYDRLLFDLVFSRGQRK